MNMIWKSKYYIVAIALSLLSTYIFLEIQEIDTSEHQEIMRSFNKLKQNDTDINQYILEARYSLLAHSGLLVNVINNIQNIKSEMRSTLLLAFLEEHISNKEIFHQMENILNQKIDKIARFQVSNAIYQNSLQYFPIITMKKIKELKAEKKDVSALYDFLAIVLTNNESNATLKNTRKKIKKYKNISILMKHEQNISTRKEKIDNIVKKILKITSLSAIDNVSQLYQEYYQEKLNKANIQELYLDVISILLVGLVFLLSYNLSRKTKIIVSLKKTSQNLYDLAIDVTKTTSRIQQTNRELLEKDEEQKKTINNIQELLIQMGHMAEANENQCTQVKKISSKIKKSIKNNVDQSQNAISSIKIIDSANHNMLSLLQNTEEIIKQTKIVSLNAAIEAAKMKNDTFNTISQKINNLATESNNSIAKTNSQLEESKEKSQKGTLLIKNIFSSLNDMDSKESELREKVEKIDDYFNEQQANLITLEETIAIVQLSTKENKGFLSENNESAKELQELSSALQKNIAKIAHSIKDF